jgi:hypothetical protein
MSWLVAATLAIAIVGGGSVVVMREDAPSGSTAVLATQPQMPALALTADVDGLSDGDLAQLMDEMNRFDALPASEPDPVISVDNGNTSEQE